MKHIIKGGGGGKGGGGSTRVAQEAPDTLQSVQYARILDLVSEGEILGLVDGDKSIFIDGTPLRNENGTYNFSGVSFDYRKGTQSQTYMAGFPSVENEVDVSSEVKFNLPITRTITNNNINAVRITVSVPALTEQNTSNGDISGSSVHLKVDIQNNGGGFYPVRLGIDSLNLSTSNNTAFSEKQIINASIDISWEGITPQRIDNGIYPVQYCEWSLQYKAGNSLDWTTYRVGNFSGSAQNSPDIFTTDMEGNVYGIQGSVISPKSSLTVDINDLPENSYSFRVLKVSGSGSLTIPRATGQKYFNDIFISGKTTSRYKRSYRIELDPDGSPWNIRVSRVTPDSTSSAIQNSTFFESYTEIIDAKLSYPNSAIFGWNIDARPFNTIPSRGYEIYGIIVQVPYNYNPITREYTGVWDGTFKNAWTNNPVWCLYDILTREIDGLGSLIDPSCIDKWNFYTIAKYCDEFVDDGFGGSEPRYTFNAFIQTRYDAFDLLTQIAASFNAVLFWSQGQIICVQDAPSEPVAIFSASNVINGEFTYSGSSRQERHTVCLVTWNDPKDQYRQKIEYVEDTEGIKKYGVVQAEITVFGCTSRGQAHRAGKRFLYSERMETETVTFKAGLEAALVYPGAVITTQDQFRSGRRYSGRVVQLISSSQIKVDSNIEIEDLKSYVFYIVMPDGTIAKRNLVNTQGTTDTLILDQPLTQTPVDYAIWALSASDLVPEMWKVVNITEEEDSTVAITALAYRPEKYDAIEKNILLDPLPTTIFETGLNSTVTDFKINEELYLVSPSVVGTAVTLSWTGDFVSYIVTYSKEGSNPVTVETKQNSITIDKFYQGLYTFSVRPVNALGVKGVASTIQKEIYGLSSAPSDVTNFALQCLSNTAYLTFDPSPDLDVKVGGYLRVKHSSTGQSWNDSLDIGTFISGTSTSAIVPLLQGTYFAKWVDSSGNESNQAVSIYTNAPSVINLNFIETITENPQFTGLKTNIGLVEYENLPALTLDSILTIDEMITPIDEWLMCSAWGGTKKQGTYEFYNEIDLGDIYTSRITSDIRTWGFNPTSVVDYWSYIDDLLRIDGDLVNDVFAKLYVKTSDDGINYSEWKPLLIADYTARAFKFKLELSILGTNSLIVSHCQVSIDMPDLTQAQEDIVSGASTYSVTYPKKFFNNPALGVTAQNMQTGDYYVLSNKTETGFDIVFKNNSGTVISRTFDYIAKGY